MAVQRIAASTADDRSPRYFAVPDPLDRSRMSWWYRPERGRHAGRLEPWPPKTNRRGALYRRDIPAGAGREAFVRATAGNWPKRAARCRPGSTPTRIVPHFASPASLSAAAAAGNSPSTVRIDPAATRHARSPRWPESCLRIRHAAEASVRPHVRTARARSRIASGRRRAARRPAPLSRAR